MSDSSETYDLVHAFHNYHDFNVQEKRARVVGVALELIKHSESVGHFETALDDTVKAIEKLLGE